MLMSITEVLLMSMGMLVAGCRNQDISNSYLQH